MPPNFLDCPLEIRSRVYDAIYETEVQLTPESLTATNCRPWQDQLNLEMSCRQIKEDMRSRQPRPVTITAHESILFEKRGKSKDAKQILNTLARLPPRITSTVTNLIILMDTPKLDLVLDYGLGRFTTLREITMRIDVDVGWTCIKGWHLECCSSYAIVDYIESYVWPIMISMIGSLRGARQVVNARSSKEGESDMSEGPEVDSGTAEGAESKDDTDIEEHTDSEATMPKVKLELKLSWHSDPDLDDGIGARVSIPAENLHRRD